MYATGDLLEKYYKLARWYLLSNKASLAIISCCCALRTILLECVLYLFHLLKDFFGECFCSSFFSGRLFCLLASVIDVDV